MGSCEPECAPIYTPPTVAQFKSQFFRDFPYAPAPLNVSTDPEVLCKYVVDLDIQNAINLAQANFNWCLFGNQSLTINLYLCAHIMVTNIRTSSAGLGSIAKFPMDSSSVGGISITNNINERFQNDPLFSGYLTTGYGKIYLDMVYPFTIGNVQISRGHTSYA